MYNVYYNSNGGRILLLKAVTYTEAVEFANTFNFCNSPNYISMEKEEKEYVE